MKAAFNSSHLLSCVRHLRNNVSDHLKDKVGSTHEERQAILHSIFDEGGITEADDDIIFEYRLNKARQLITSKAPDLSTYFDTRIVSLLKENLSSLLSAGQNIVAPRILTQWTNNNCESINHVLKQSVNWKAKNITDLTNTLHDLIKSQYKSVQQSFFGQGDYILHKPFRQYEVDLNIWCGLPKEKRQQHFKRFQAKRWVADTTTVISSDGTTTTKVPSHGGKKPHQVKRKASERTRTAKRKGV